MLEIAPLPWMLEVIRSNTGRAVQARRVAVSVTLHESASQICLITTVPLAKLILREATSCAYDL
jgi:hypothetical protein